MYRKYAIKAEHIKSTTNAHSIGSTSRPSGKLRYGICDDSYALGADGRSNKKNPWINAMEEGSLVNMELLWTGNLSAGKLSFKNRFEFLQTGISRSQGRNSFDHWSQICPTFKKPNFWSKVLLCTLTSILTVCHQNSKFSLTLEQAGISRVK